MATSGKDASAARRGVLVEAQLDDIERGAGDGEVDMGRGISLKVTSLAKPYFRGTGDTKGALMRYYARIWPFIHPHVKDRPLVLRRFPDGADGPVFYQQNAPEHVPHGVRVETVVTGADGPKRRIIGGDLSTLLYTVQLGAMEIHPWLSRTGSIDSADQCVIDLDPGDDVPFSAVVELARDVLAIARECELPMAVKTSGASGMHLVIPLPPRTSYERSGTLAMLLARAVAVHRPDRATTERTVRARPSGTIYVDAFQNARGKSVACAYSVRATPDATVSAPVRVAELTPRLRMGTFTIESIPARIMRVGDTWKDALAARPTARAITNAIVALERVIAATPEPSDVGPGPKRRRRGGGDA